MPLYLGLVLCLGIFGASYLLNRRTVLSASNAELRFEGDELAIVFGEHERRIERASLAGGYYDGVGRLTLELADGAQLELGCEETQAEMLLDAAGLAAEQRATKLPLASFASRWRWAPALLAITSVPLVFMVTATCLWISIRLSDGRGLAFFVSAGHRYVMWLFSAAAAWWVAARANRPRSVTIGTDSLILQGTFRRRVVAMRDIVALEPNERGVTLVLTDAKRIDLPAHTTQAALTEHGAERRDAVQALRQRIHVALSRDVATDLSGDVLAKLERQGRDNDAWKEAVCELSAASGRYRGQHVSRAQLAGVVRDASLDPEQRIGAALALSTMRDEHREVIDATAAATASELLAEQLRAAARGEVHERSRKRSRIAAVEETPAATAFLAEEAEEDALEAEQRSAPRDGGSEVAVAADERPRVKA